mmetsp:Transcript_12036/g.44747  ORF Transcript_12036/g.44747 Transcript_12036/m.44747 type:complete len:307 (+) Transcript_12036:1674-2594(+)
MPSKIHACSLREIRLKSETWSFKDLSAAAYKSHAPRCSFASSLFAVAFSSARRTVAACASAKHTSRMVSAIDASNSLGRSPGRSSFSWGRMFRAACLYRPAATRSAVAIAGADSPSTGPGDFGDFSALVCFPAPGGGVSSTEPPMTTNRSSSVSCLAGPTTARGRSSTATTASWRLHAARIIHAMPNSCFMSLSLNVLPRPSRGLFHWKLNRCWRSAVTPSSPIFPTSASRCGTYSSAACERAAASVGLPSPLNAHSIRRLVLSARTSDRAKDSSLEISFSNTKGSVTRSPAKSKGGSIVANATCT